jgi:hypothetical protein
MDHSSPPDARPTAGPPAPKPPAEATGGAAAAAAMRLLLLGMPRPTPLEKPETMPHSGDAPVPAFGACPMRLALLALPLLAALPAQA